VGNNWDPIKEVVKKTVWTKKGGEKKGSHGEVLEVLNGKKGGQIFRRTIRANHHELRG